MTRSRAHARRKSPARGLARARWRVASRMAALCLLALPAVVLAEDVSVHASADLRLVGGSAESSWTEGGFGKSRFGDGNAGAPFANAALSVHWQVTPAWSLATDVRYQSRLGSALSVTEAFARYRPVSTDAWRWSLKLGEFFPPISLENDGIGWTSLWTLTPSAINSWVGEELRTFGAEARVEHRGDGDTLSAGVALFGANDPAGEILASRGWSLSDLVAGIGSRLREPDAYATRIGVAPPRRYDPFLEIDHRVGIYADAEWQSAQFGRLRVLYYDNRADPSTYHPFGTDELFSWRTRFVSAGAQTQIDRLELVAQAMDGSTQIAPPGFASETHFSAAYVLASWNLGAWRPALRVDAFSTRKTPDFPPRMAEHGTAVTLALNWRPVDWLRLTGEALRIDSTRDQRVDASLAPHQTDTQIQLNARFLY
ncbi:MAG: hypothetical protein ABI846_11910 [Rudaea sp.]